MACLDDGVIARYVRGESPSDEVARVRAHRAECPRCEVRVAQAEERFLATNHSERTQVDSFAHSFGNSYGNSYGTGASASGAAMKPAPLLERGVTVGRYLVVDRVGEGGMGVVYAAYDPELNRKVAIKLLRATGGSSDEGQARLLREAQAMARVQHPNVISVFDVGTLGDRVFVAMEFVEGQTLSRWVKEEPRPWRAVLAAFLEAGKGLAAAHDVGLVHRDFKPENVIIGRDGRVRVMDFGLARMDSSLSTDTVPSLPALKRSPSTSGPELSEALTQDGEVMGTPQYMAPEQRLGMVADARSDQFSFCAALYWALYRTPPFDPMQLAAAAIDAAEAVTASGVRPLNFARTVIKEPPKEPSVPAWLKRAMLRGLQLAPDARFPSMQALLDELGMDRYAGRLKWMAAAAGLVLVAGGVGLTYQQVSRRAQLCGGAEAQLAHVWDGPIQATIQSAFGATGKPYAARSWEAVKQRLDAYSQGWVAMRREACEDTRIRGVQTEQLLSLRMVCLDRRLKEMRALTRLLSSADGAVVEKAVDAALALPSLRQCADVEALSAPVSPPEDPAAQAKIEKISSTLASAKALGDAGKYKQALEVAQTASATASELQYLPLQAEALQLLGWLQAMSGDDKKGMATLGDAVWTAESGRHDPVKALAASRLVYVAGYLQGRGEEAEPWSRLASATLNRLGGGETETQIELYYGVGSARVRQGRLAEGQAAYEKAEALAAREFGPLDPRRAVLLSSLGFIYVQQGELDKGRKALLQALDLIEKVRGPDHPSAAYPHSALAELYQASKDHPNALLHIRKAFSIWQAAFGPKHPIVGGGHDSVGSILFQQESYAEALVEYTRAIEVKVAALGPDHPNLGYSYDGLGRTYVRLGKMKEAVPYLEHALKLNPSAADTRFFLAEALWSDKRERARARALALQALETFRQMKDEAGIKEVEALLAQARR
jgi:tetratricopeptide (TPR) repeat protein/predicted Ser/Thr protein kinase